MQKLLNDGWQFAKLPVGSTAEDAARAEWRAVDIPHDWLISQTDDLYESGDGWYRRKLTADAENADKCWILRFDGVYMDCDVLLDGEVLRTHRYGYTPFDVELTGRMSPGDHQLMVHVRYRSPNSRWYSGAGIYRDVTLSVLPSCHLVPDGLYVHSEPENRADLTGAWRMEIGAEIAGDGEPVRVRLEDPDGAPAAEAEVCPENGRIRTDLRVARARLWSCAEPCLYTLRLTCAGEEHVSRVGLRTTAFDPDRGFLLNGAVTKLHGVCLHHDLGALGAAFNPAAYRRQIRLMKAMGVNALRTSHNPPAARAMDILDEEGILVIDEAFDMWERPKTTYDYGNYFPQCWAEDIAAMVRRDRNHPCVIMWSIGNEIYDTHASPRGEEVTVMLRDGVRSHDPRENGRVTIGSNYMPWEGAQRCADQLKVAGYNYAEKYYRPHHQAHPDWVIYGSETASALSSRGVYHFPRSVNILSEDDLQCSALGNSVTAWGTPDMRRCINDDEATPFSMGQFLWSGTDYIGEPTPYHTRSCYFGMADTAGFPKDYYYQVQAGWTRTPMAHIGVSWDWNPGQMIDVPVYTNLREAELFADGVSCGKQEVKDQVCWWRIPFGAKKLTAAARGEDAEGRPCEVRDEAAQAGDSASLRLTADRKTLKADAEDMAFLTVEALDADGLPVANAVDRVKVDISGPIRLMGVDNGDPTDEDGYKTDSRRLFGGKLLIMIGAEDRPGEARVTVSAPGLKGDSLTLALTPAEIPAGRSRCFAGDIAPGRADSRIGARRILLTAEGSTRLTPGHPEVFVRAGLLPANAAPQDIECRIVNAAGIATGIAAARWTEGGVLVTAAGDGEAYLRASCRNGSEHSRIISQLEISVSGFGALSLDPYQFVTAGLCDLSDGIGAGNDKGIAFSRESFSYAGFRSVDFGAAGSDRITLPIFALDGSRYELTLWDGVPGQGGRKVCVLSYQKPSIWNTYQEETWQLPERLTGLHTICFSSERKVHLRGFVFERQSRAFLPQRAADADEIYGDSYRRAGDSMEDIGNNVSLVWHQMDFGEGGPVRLCLSGRTPLEINSVNLRLTDAKGETASVMCPFRGGERGEQVFGVTAPSGLCDVSFVFLPGSQFCFDGFRFEKPANKKSTP